MTWCDGSGEIRLSLRTCSLGIRFLPSKQGSTQSFQLRWEGAILSSRGRQATLIVAYGEMS